MKFKEIQSCIYKKDYLFSEHADEERTKDQLTVKDIEEAIISGTVIEERPADVRGESRLVTGKNRNGKLIHIVIGIRNDKPVIVTVYTPDEDLWLHGIIRKKGKHE